MKTKLFIIALLALISLQCSPIRQTSLPAQYRVAWYLKADSTNSGYGEWDTDSTLVREWVIFGNTKWPELYHFIERK